MMEDALLIIPFEKAYAKEFAALNLAWISKHFVVEQKDEEVLGNPQKFIIDKGGYIFFAKLNQEIVGTFAFLKTAEGVYELSKMAVHDSYHGKGIGNKMLEFSLEEAKKLKFEKVILYSNTLLKPAIHLYEKYGFKEVPLENSDYKRSNIKMEIDIKK